jgi:uncharacterized membrane protein
MASFYESAFLLIVLGVFVTLFGTYNGIIYNNSFTGDLKNIVRDNLTTFFWVCVGLVSLLAFLSIFWIRQNPIALNPYLMVVSHISLLLSLSAVSFSTMTITN